MIAMKLFEIERQEECILFNHFNHRRVLVIYYNFDMQNYDIFFTSIIYETPMNMKTDFPQILF